MPEPTDAQSKDNRANFLKARAIFLLIGILILLGCLSSYSPSEDPVSFHGSFFSLLTLGCVFGSLAFGVGTAIAASIWLPSTRYNRFCPQQDSFEIKWDDGQPDESSIKKNWDNDYANVASPMHDIIKRSHYHDG